MPDNNKERTHATLYGRHICGCTSDWSSQRTKPSVGSHNPATKDGSPHTVSAPADGANSFTEDQAHGRLAKAGYTKIGKLTKNDGLWTTTAVKGGKSHKVALDYKGNITVR